jgi:hypothetical protein
MLVGKNALKDQEFLTFRVSVAGKCTARRVSDDAGCPRHFIANAIQHETIDTGFR